MIHKTLTLSLNQAAGDTGRTLNVQMGWQVKRGGVLHLAAMSVAVHHSMLFKILSLVGVVMIAFKDGLNKGRKTWNHKSLSHCLRFSVSICRNCHWLLTLHE